MKRVYFYCTIGDTLGLSFKLLLDTRFEGNHVFFYESPLVEVTRTKSHVLYVSDSLPPRSQGCTFQLTASREDNFWFSTCETLLKIEDKSLKLFPDYEQVEHPSDYIRSGTTCGLPYDV